MKRVLSLALAVLMLLSTINIAYASAPTMKLEYSIDTSTLTVSGTSTGKSGDVLLFLIYGYDVSSGTYDKTVPKVADAIQLGSGTYSNDIKLPSWLASGKYVVRTSINGEETESAFMYVNTTTAVPSLAAINGATAATMETVLNTDGLECGLDPDVYALNKTYISNIIYAYKPSAGYTLSELYDTFVKAYFAVRLKGSESVLSLLNEYSGYCRGTSPFVECKKRYDDIDSTLTALFETELKSNINFADSRGFERIFKETAIYIESVNTGNWNDLKNVLQGTKNGNVINNNAEILSFDTTDYDKLSNKDNVFREMFSSKSQMTSIDSIRALFASTAKKLLGTEKEKGFENNQKTEGTNGVISYQLPNVDINSNVNNNAALNDISGHWGEGYIKELCKKKILSGFEDGTFRPDAEVTRSQFISMIVKAFGLQGGNAAEFSDVSSDAWYYSALTSAVANGIAYGDDENRFNPDSPITREDIATLIYRCMQKTTTIEEGMSGFMDDGDISSYARQAVIDLAGAGIINGYEDNNFVPKKTASRAEAATVIYNALGYINVEETEKVNKDEEDDEIYAEARAVVESVLKELDIPSDKQKAVTKADFLNYVLAAIKYMGVSDYETTYTDVSGDLKKQVAYAQNIGMIENGTIFGADEEILYESALRMAVVATGRTAVANNTNYVSLAADAKLTKNLKGLNIDVRNAVVLLYNILTCDIMTQSLSLVDRSYKVESGANLLETLYGTSWYEGIVVANMYTSLTSAAGHTEDGKIKVGNKIFESNRNDLLGYFVRVYYDKETEEMIAIYPKNNSVKTINEEVKLDGTTLKYGQTNSQKTARLDNTYQVIFNGKAYMESGYENEFLYKNGKVTLIDNNNDSRYDVVLLTKYDFMYVRSVDIYNKRIYDKNDDAVIDMSGDDCGYNIYYVSEDGTESVSFSSISSNKVITYALSKDGNYCDIYIVDDVVSGKITSMNWDEYVVEIGDNEYRVNPYFAKYYANSLGKKGNFKLGLDGSVVAFNDESASQYSYAWIAKVWKKSKKEDFRIMLYTENGEMVEYTVDDKIIVDGEKKTWEDAFTILSGLTTDNQHVIRYRGDEKLIAIDTADTSMSVTAADVFKTNNDSDNALKMYYTGALSYRDKSYGGPSFGEATGTMGDYVFLGGSTKILKIPNNTIYWEDADYYSIGSTDDWDSGETETINAYDMSSNGEAGLVWYSYNPAATFNNKKGGVTAVIADIKDQVFVDDEVKTQYTLVSGTTGKYIDCVLWDGADTATKTVMSAIKEGDIIRYSRNSRGEITKAVLDYDISSASFAMSYTDNKVQYAKGYLLNYQDKKISIIADSNTGSISTIPFNQVSTISTDSGSLVLVTYKKDGTGAITNVDVKTSVDTGEFRDYRTYQNNADLVVARRRIGRTQMTVIYREEK